MTEMQKEMQKLISKDELDKAFDARFPKEMQVKLHNARVAIAGLGGLGSNIAVMLARSGVGQLLLVDYDVVDVTNLNRQMYYIQHIGKPKAQALPEILYQINPYSNYQSCSVKVTERNVQCRKIPSVISVQECGVDILYSHAQKMGCNKIALGHHYDDVIETILMGMLYSATGADDDAEAA